MRLIVSCLIQAITFSNLTRFMHGSRANLFTRARPSQVVIIFDEIIKLVIGGKFPYKIKALEFPSVCDIFFYKGVKVLTKR